MQNSLFRQFRHSNRSTGLLYKQKSLPLKKKFPSVTSYKKPPSPSFLLSSAVLWNSSENTFCYTVDISAGAVGFGGALKHVLTS